jgi:hypothetical protein
MKAPDPLTPLVESPAPVYTVGIGIGIACGALVLLVLGLLTL